MKTKSIGVFGLSGVGKTTLINKFLPENPGYLHLQAGSLIKQGLAEKDTCRDSLRLKTSDGIDDNQRILIEQYHMAISEKADNTIIFDGHMVIDTDQELVEIPMKVIELLKLDKILSITASPDRILAQRSGYMSRKRPDRTIIDIDKQQKLSTHLCKEYAENIDISFCEIDVSNDKQFFDACLNI